MIAQKSIWQGMMTVCLLLLLNFSFAQQSRVSGKVSDVTSEPIPGTTVLVKGTTRGTVTDVDGSYSIQAASGETLVYSFVGFETKEILVGNSQVIDVILSEGLALSEVVVTALGVERDAKALGYAVQAVDGSRFTEARETNVLNSLSGRVAGVQVTNSSTGLGGSTLSLIHISEPTRPY